MMIPRSLISLALVAGSVAVAASCGDPSSVTADPSVPGLLAAKRKVTTESTKVSTGQLVYCKALPYTESVTQVIGPEGGVLVVGGHVLLVDVLALSAPVSITAVAPEGSLNMVRFYPEGLQFAIGANGFGALVATNLDNCTVHPNQVLKIVHVSDALSILSYVPAPSATDSAVVMKYKTYLGSLWAAGLLSHFSNYAVAY